MGDSSVKLPGPDDDATPFMLRCRVRHTPFRPLHEFDPAADRDEFRLYLWRSASLRDVTSMLHMRDPALSSPMSLHTFRVVFYDGRRDAWAARDVKGRVTRLPAKVVNGCLEDVTRGEEEMERNQSLLVFTKTLDRVKPRLPSDADEEAAKTTLDELDLTDGDILECIISRSTSVAPLTGGRRVRLDSAGTDHSRGWSRKRDPF